MGGGAPQSPALQRWAALLLLLFLPLLGVGNWHAVEASHKEFKEYQNYEAEEVDGEDVRTGFHFQPRPMYYNGLYHLFYQYNPKGAVWGNIVWAHSVSGDLINWISLPPALYSSKSFDIKGCWSGSATILPGNKPAMLYTGVDTQNRQVQNIAFPKDASDKYLREWDKPDYNPVIPPTAGVNASAFRDPTTGWRGADGSWRVVVGSKDGSTGVVLLYRSRDFVHWSKAPSPLHSAAGTGMWECPDFYPVALRGNAGLDTSATGPGLKHVLKVSLDETRYDYYTVGKYSPAEDRYVPDGTSPDDRTGLRYDYGNFYASKTFYDPAKKRRVLWGWSNESDSVSSDVKKGWAGIQVKQCLLCTDRVDLNSTNITIPRAVWLDGSGKQLVQWPVEEVEKLRGKRVEAHGVALGKGEHFEIKGITTSQTDVEVTFEVSGLEKAEEMGVELNGQRPDPQALCEQKGADLGGGVGPFGLWVLASDDFTERTAVFFRVFKPSGESNSQHSVLMCHDASRSFHHHGRSTTEKGVWKPSFAGFVDVDIQKDGKISLRSLIDGSVVESFGAGGKTCITSRVYPVGTDAHLYAFNNGEADVKISQLQAWQMHTIDMK
ncbi:hypothetical protein Taro_032850 [Colocasia esculenta]|uniref:Uncharacterized protein n=1 Tax=Colocasia esculenta TaxID=4460 RepID=A0A843WAN6_COLES|nr:hypothetical protein [Colocasia esculenta]